MGNRLYVGNLSYNTSSADLQNLFGQHGSVQQVDVVMDRDTGRSKGFGFVQMSTDDEAKAAIASLHEHELDGRNLTVNEARPREERPRSSNGGFGNSQGRANSRGYAGGRKGY